jgi:hypothetical protein
MRRDSVSAPREGARGGVVGKLRSTNQTNERRIESAQPSYARIPLSAAVGCTGSGWFRWTTVVL